jgi:hypothetical protein
MLVEDKYGWDRIAEKLLATYMEIIGKQDNLLSIAGGE